MKTRLRLHLSMPQTRQLVFAAVGALLACTAAREAAAEPVGSEVAARSGVAFGQGLVDFGIGARAGASIASFYFGVSVMEYFTPTHAIPDPLGGASSASESFETFFYGLELGYDLKPLPWLTIRPGLGAGMYSHTGTCQPGCVIDDRTEPYVAPSVTGLVLLGPHLILGADLDAALEPDHGGVAYGAHAQVGVRF